MEVSNIQAEGFNISYYPLETCKTLNDIHFQATELGEAINILFAYSTDIFKLETIRQMISDFVRILECTTENPGILISQIDIDPAEEKV